MADVVQEEQLQPELHLDASEGIPTSLTVAPASPTGRKRETTDTSILSLSAVGLFPVPPSRSHSFDSVTSAVGLTLEAEVPAAPTDVATVEEDSSLETTEEWDAPSLLEPEDMTDTEALATELCLGSSPALSELIEQMRARQLAEDDEVESEVGEYTITPVLGHC
jgi:hypothetical protein